jgi:predicted ATP-dependent endonuclease of OLD family
MKIRSITIPELYHFKNLHLDLTYPAGHPKEGKALDKVCFIGQSGTGKTTLLKLISVFSYREDDYAMVSPLDKLKKIETEVEFDAIIAKLAIDKSNGFVVLYPTEATKNGETIDAIQATNTFRDFLASDGLKSISFPADLVYDMDISPNIENSYDNVSWIDFSVEKAANIWNIILGNIQKYQEEELIIRQEISKVAEKSNNISEIQVAVKRLEDWRRSKFNPVEDVAEQCLNRLLKHFGLRVKTELDFQKKDDIGFLKIEDFSGNEVPNGLLSTGTKQIMLSALPLYLLKANKCQILYDEPERSLYPDLQRIIIDYYRSLTTDSQFFISTHSPIIASTFEPWEIVELKFDENYNIYRDLYYTGENHVDNYFVDPRYLDYDAVLKKVFDLKQTSTDMRTEAIVELTMLRNQLDKLKADKKLGTPEGNELLSRYKALAKKLSWETA